MVYDNMWPPIVRVGFDLIDARSRYGNATNNHESLIYQMLTKLITEVTNLVKEVRR